MKRISLALLTCLLFGLPGYAFAWDSFGHMVVAGVAWQDLDQAHTAAVNLSAADAPLAAIGDEAKWLEESFALAKSDVYVTPIKGGKGPYALSVAYKSKAKTIAQQRVSLAGARLARLIQEVL